METMTFGQMMRTSLVMPVLVLLSVLVVAQALERIYSFWFAGRLPAKTFDRIKRRLQKGDREGALGVCRTEEGVVTDAFHRILSLPQPDSDNIAQVFQLYRQRLQMDLSRRLGFFGTVSFIAPLIGLMGTVMGIMRAFHDLAVAGAGGPGVVAAGISEALVATAAGIGVAVMSSILYNYFTLTVRHRLSTVDLWVLELADMLQSPAAE